MLNEHCFVLVLSWQNKCEWKVDDAVPSATPFAHHPLHTAQNPGFGTSPANLPAHELTVRDCVVTHQLSLPHCWLDFRECIDLQDLRMHSTLATHSVLYLSSHFLIDCHQIAQHASQVATAFLCSLPCPAGSRTHRSQAALLQHISDLCLLGRCTRVEQLCFGCRWPARLWRQQ